MTRTEKIRAHFDAIAPALVRWRKRNHYYHEDQRRYFQYLIKRRASVLELGCGNGELLRCLDAERAVGVDISQKLIEQARGLNDTIDYYVGDAQRLRDVLPNAQFDYIVLADLVGYLEDIQETLQGLHRYCRDDTRVIVSYYNFLWQPVLQFAEKIGAKMPTTEQSWLSPEEIENLLMLADFDVVKVERRLLFPKYVPIVSWLINKIATLPFINKLCLSHYVVARPVPRRSLRSHSVSVVIPCKNEQGNVEPAVRRLPAFGDGQEIIFVDGHSTDGTVDEIKRVITLFPEKTIRLLPQVGHGKGDAVRQGFADAGGDVLMILDADLTVPPEDLPKFYSAIAGGKAEFLNGCRLVYPMEGEAMRAINLLGNKFFAMIFSWLLGQRLKDTLCGTKVLRRDDYARIVENRSYFGDFDPFGDFDLLFGASKLNLKIIEIPIRYRRRTYGETKIHRFRHGWLLLRMVVYAMRKFKSV